MKSIAYRICALLFGTTTLLSGALKAESLSFRYASANSGTTSAMGLQITLPQFTDPNQTGWELTFFTWLAPTTNSSAATGRGLILVFDGSFDPTDLTTSQVNSNTTSASYIATSKPYSNGQYSFATPLILEGGQTYLFLNNQAISTTVPTSPAPHKAGYDGGVTATGITMWRNPADGSANAKWQTYAGVPHFQATFTPVLTTVPEPATIASILGFVGIALFLFKRRR